MKHQALQVNSAPYGLQVKINYVSLVGYTEILTGFMRNCLDAWILINPDIDRIALHQGLWDKSAKSQRRDLATTSFPD